MKTTKIAVIGATGLVGQTMLKALADYPDVTVYAPAKHRGEQIEGRTIRSMEELEQDESQAFLLATDKEVSFRWAPLLARRGVVVDNSSAFRLDPAVPLVVPEVNPEAICAHKGIIANPNCSTIQAVVALSPLRRWGIEAVRYCTYQAVSGAGKGGISDYERGTTEVFPYPIRDNVIPQIDDFLPDGYTKEEYKMREETRKILCAPRLPVSATCIRVPVLNCHTVSISVRLDETPSVEEIREALKETCEVLDAPQKRVYPYPLLADGRDCVLAGRVRRDPDDPHLYHLITVADNLRKGAATNAVQIVCLLAKRGLLHA